MIKDLAELKKFLTICRRSGLKEIKCGDISVVFGDLPQKTTGGSEESEEIETDELTPEQLAFFSVGGGPLT